MSRTWNRGVGVLAIAVASGTGVAGVDAASAAVDRNQAAQPEVADVQPAAVVSPPAITGLGSVKSLRVETARLRKHVARHKVREQTPRELGRAMAASRGWGAAQFACLDSLWTNESDWSIHAQNRSGAYGIPQALPGPKLATAGSNWRNSPRTQITWGLDYIAHRHGTPCSAWAYWRSHHWY